MKEDINDTLRNEGVEGVRALTIGRGDIMAAKMWRMLRRKIRNRSH